MNYTNSIEQRKNLFLENAKKVHGDRYDYSKVVYTRAQEKVEIICPAHGSFWQIPDTHRNGRGCRKCGFIQSKPTSFSKSLTTEQFVEKANLKHNNFYSYEHATYTKRLEKITITCPEHGNFEQQAGNHLVNGAGCPKCGIKKAHNHFRASTEEFIKKSRKIHGNLYDYSKTIYKGKHFPVLITCKEHGDFELKMAQWHYTSSCMGCPKCSSGSSLQEQSLAAFVMSLGLETVVGDRTIIKPLELDIVIPELKIAIEYNGLYWHSEQAGKDKGYHLNKLNLANKAGYRLIQIFEDEWINKRSIVESKLRHILGKDTDTKVFARKLTVSTVSSKEATTFFDTHHVQGGCSASKHYGLFNGDVLVACISFGVNRFTKEGGIELIRYATSCNVVGGFSKLMKHFQRQNPEVKSLTSYSDRRWSEGNVYEKNGFKLEGISQPGYFYANNEGIRYNRVLFQKHKLEKKLTTFDPTKTEVENMLANGYFRVFDCGMHKWGMELK